MHIFKKGWLAPVLLLGCLLAKAQTETAGDKGTRKAPAKTIEINGTVTDAASHGPLRAINVTYQDYSAAITDSNGRFKLRVPNDNVTIVLQAEGYQTKEVALRGRKQITTALFEDTYTSFYDVAVLPYATQSVSRTPYALTSVQATNNWAHAAETPDAFFQGKSTCRAAAWRRKAARACWRRSCSSRCRARG